MTPYAAILAGYLGLLGAALVVEVLGRVGRDPFRPLAVVLEAAMDARGGRLLVWAAWAWIGFHFLAR